MDENKEFKECNCDEHYHNKTENWIKFALILLALFLACYLAVYYIMDQMRHAYYVPAMPMENIDRIMKEQDKMFEDMGALPMNNKAFMNIKNPVETYKDDSDDSYKMIIDLKPFNNNPDNINLDIQNNKISISGKAEKTKKHSENVYSFSQSFVLPENIDTNNVKKEIKHHKYIITMPIED